MQISYQNLKLTDYEGAGNKTPILDISQIKSISVMDPIVVRKALEKDVEFRKWLKSEGLKHRADSVMIFYRASNSEYDFVTFIGEPNSPIENNFSEMCGNGIRSLALHILLIDQENLHKHITEGIRIWAGSLRTLFVNGFDPQNLSAEISVNLGKIRTESQMLQEYVDIGELSSADLSNIILSESVPDYLSDRHFGLGFNGENRGEPHLVLVNNIKQYNDLINIFDLPKELNEKTILNNLRIMVSYLGKNLTFKSKLFPNQINFNIALVYLGKIYVSTHERNMSSGYSECFDQIMKKGVCKCNTMACGTGGSIVCAIIKKQRLLSGNEFVTIHPGGQLNYRIENDESIMIGPARKVASFPVLSKNSSIE